MGMDLLGQLETIFNTSPGWGLVASFAAGILTSFSPCVYPLIPVTLGIVGARSVSSPAKGFFLSFIFVSGIACAYTLLGVVASLLGIFLAKFFINPYTFFLLFVVYLLLALSLFDVVRIPILVAPKGYKQGHSWFSLFSLGFLSALAITPCIFPVLGSILGMISLKKNVAYGALALLLFSFGYGFLLLLIGTFSSFMARLPKNGPWLIIVKRALGAILIFCAVYFGIKGIVLIKNMGVL
jgi:cytochrome c-type biogenesis protein